MSTRALLRYVAKLRHAHSHLRLECRHISSRQKKGKHEGEEENGPEKLQSLVYNPSAYYQNKVERSVLLRDASGLDEEKEAGSPAVVSAVFRQPGNPYTVSSSRRLSSAKNMLLGLALNGEAAGKRNKPVKNQKGNKLDVKVDTRAFQRCRPEYSSFTHDVSRRPAVLHIKEALLLLHKVTLIKGNMEPSDITSLLCELGRVAPEQTVVVRGDTCFYMLLRHTMESLPSFTHTQLLEILQSFLALELSPSHAVLGQLESEFARRAGVMELRQLLLAADLWRSLRCSVPQYLERLGDVISRHFGQMGPPELVQFMYVLGESRYCPASLLPPLEVLLMRHLDRLKGEELVTVCLGLFKSQSSLSEGAVRRLVDRTLAVIEHVSDFGLVNVMKLMRFSHLDHVPWLEAMANEVPRRAPQMGVQGLMHVALACSALHYRDDRILLSVAQHLPQKASHYRSKDAAKLLWAFGTLGIVPGQYTSLYSGLTEVLRERQAEFQRFPEHLLTALLGLAFAGEFPHDLLSLALSPTFIRQASQLQKMELKKDLFTLDGTVGIELPGWTGPRLSPPLREEVTKQLWDYAQSDVCLKMEVVEAESMLKELLGGEAFVCKRMILPHMRSIDLEVHLDPSDKPLSLTSDPLVGSPASDEGSCGPLGWEAGHVGVNLTDDLLAQLTHAKNTLLQPSACPARCPNLCPVEPQGERGGILSVGVDLSDDLWHALTKRKGLSPAVGQVPSRPARRRLAIQVTNRNHYCYRTRQLLGLHAMKRRQLELEGYGVVELPYWEWLPLLRRARVEKLAYLHCKIFSSLEAAKR
ncbi:FAST kinase domain-containing protein 5, mitochondrial [Electrophorus electricus]|uniref:FAST kinase domain-containing protein 5, mitochondrial n=1 Tax=Electrophorus electricus TaxID=8005 RepID=UPI0015D03BA3|nr:FAST kinase domain-containing protein 5, mitochondrial [Electrophorus electricus]